MWQVNKQKERERCGRQQLEESGGKLSYQEQGRENEKREEGEEPVAGEPVTMPCPLLLPVSFTVATSGRRWGWQHCVLLSPHVNEPFPQSPLFLHVLSLPIHHLVS